MNETIVISGVQMQHVCTGFHTVSTGLPFSSSKAWFCTPLDMIVQIGLICFITNWWCDDVGKLVLYSKISTTEKNAQTISTVRLSHSVFVAIAVIMDFDFNLKMCQLLLHVGYICIFWWVSHLISSWSIFYVFHRCDNHFQVDIW